MAELQPTPASQAPPLSQGQATNVSVNPSMVPYARVQYASQNAFTNYKSILQQCVQKARMLLPVYAYANEGSPHAPRFRATVTVNGTKYTSPYTFTHRKAAEQDAARHAMENMTPIAINEESFNVNEALNHDKVFSKSILNELVMKVNLGKPTYDTVHADVEVHAFRSTVFFYGYSYAGEARRNKKEAEQSAAHVAIRSLLGTEFKTVLSEIIQAKDKLYASMYRVNDNSNVSMGQQMVVSAGDGVVMEKKADNPQTCIVQDTKAQVSLPPHHEFRKPGRGLLDLYADGSSGSTTTPPVASVPQSVLPRQVVFVPPKAQANVQQTGLKKRKRKSKNKARNVRVGPQLPLAPMAQVHMCQAHCSTAPMAPMAPINPMAPMAQVHMGQAYCSTAP